MCATKGWSHCGYKSWGLLALRLALGSIFTYAGYGKLFLFHGGVVAMLSGLGFPAPEFLAWVLGLAEFAGGIMILFGILAPLAAVWLAVDMIIALFTAHRGQSFAEMYAPIALLGGCLSLIGSGAGRFRILKYQCLCGPCRADKGEYGICANGENCGCGHNGGQETDKK